MTVYTWKPSQVPASHHWNRVHGACVALTPAITDSGSGSAEYTLDLKNGSGKPYKGAAGAPKPSS